MQSGPRITPSRFTFPSAARKAYAERIRDGSIDALSRQGGDGIPLDVLAAMRAKATERAEWGELTEYYAMELFGRLTYASITRGRGGEIARVFSASGQLLARGVYPVDEEGKPCGDVLWR